MSAFHIYGRRKSLNRDLLLQMEALKLGACLIHPMERRAVHCLQATISYHFVGKTFRTHYVDGRIFILRVR